MTCDEARDRHARESGPRVRTRGEPAPAHRRPLLTAEPGAGAGTAERTWSVAWDGRLEAFKGRDSTDFVLTAAYTARVLRIWQSREAFGRRGHPYGR